ncbi:MAG: hypothetical protein U1E13_13835, partial [Methylophilaceae bacterium]|nr:hypothetical protein [Methylophilaceae bacterium]
MKTKIRASRAWGLLLSMAFVLPAHGMCDSVPCTLGIREIITDHVIPGFCTTASKLDSCCTNIATDFRTTWTMLNNLENKIDNVAPCNATPLFAPQTIATPGFYCLAQDITLSPGDSGFTISAP